MLSRRRSPNKDLGFYTIIHEKLFRVLVLSMVPATPHRVLIPHQLSPSPYWPVTVLLLLLLDILFHWFQGTVSSWCSFFLPHSLPLLGTHLWFLLFFLSLLSVKGSGLSSCLRIYSPLGNLILSRVLTPCIYWQFLCLKILKVRLINPANNMKLQLGYLIDPQDGTLTVQS